ncbi:recombinase family protein [Lentzea atacamensis]|uniref:recombinase family protein n=1 Tax=Lentzea atacamensis TaxID=531938 RepID=UPI002D7853A3|nr:recombinase family protein [Lentzea atacamensis]
MEIPEWADPCQKPRLFARVRSLFGGTSLSRRSRAKKVGKAAASPLDLDTVRVGVYMRRSTDDENQPYSIEAQDTRLEAYVASQPGWKIVKKFQDDASGKTTDRPDLQKAMQWAKSNMIDVLLVYRVDRFSRSLRDTVSLLEELDKVGVAFRSATEPFDTSTPVGRMMVNLLAMFAQFERDLIVDRVTAGMERAADNGQWKGGPPPYGYKTDPVTHRLLCDEAEAVIIRLIFDLYTQDRLGSRAIANELNERGHRTRSGGLWAFKRILSILENDAYVGEIHYRDIVTKDAHKPIISREQFTEAVRLMDQRGDSHSHRAASGSDYIATGRLPCPKCKHAMIGTRATGKTKTYRYYTCMKRLKYGKDSCDQDRINADALDQAILDSVASFYSNQHDLIREAVDAARKVYESSHDGVAAELKTVKTEISRVTAKIDKYLDAFEADAFDAHDDAAKERMRQHRTTQKQLRAREAELLEELENEPTMPDAATLDTVNHNIREIIKAGNPNQRKAIVETFVVKIKITGPGRITPVFRVPQAATAPALANAEGAEPGISDSAPLGVRACSSLVELRGLEPLTLTLPV